MNSNFDGHILSNDTGNLCKITIIGCLPAQFFTQNDRLAFRNTYDVKLIRRILCCVVICVCNDYYFLQIFFFFLSFSLRISQRVVNIIISL